MNVCKNVGGIDRGVRAVAGAVALIVAFTILDAGAGAVLGLAAAGAGAVLLLTAALGVCPLYLPMNLSTCRVAKR
jgi:hypothetical protein